MIKQGAAAVLLVFSFTDRSSFEEVDSHLSKVVVHPNSSVCPIVIGMRYSDEPCLSVVVHVIKEMIRQRLDY